MYGAIAGRVFHEEAVTQRCALAANLQSLIIGCQMSHAIWASTNGPEPRFTAKPILSRLPDCQIDVAVKPDSGPDGDFLAWTVSGPQDHLNLLREVLMWVGEIHFDSSEPEILKFETPTYTS